MPTQNDSDSKTNAELLDEIRELKITLQEYEDTLSAIQNGEIDAIITQGPEDSKVYTLEGTDSLYRGLIQEMNDGVATLTADGTIFYSNNQLSNLLKMPLEQVSGNILQNFVLDDDLEAYHAIFDEGLAGNGAGEINIKSVDGTIIPVMISIKTLKDLGAYAVITDLSEHKHHEELKIAQKQLQVSLDTEKQLTKELQTSNEELNCIKEELEKSNEELEHFAYVASHDLREPLRMITNFLQLLEHRYDNKLDEDAHEFIGFAVDGAKRLDNMINDLLEYSRVTKLEINLSQVNMEKVLNDTLRNLTVQIDENNAIITHDPLPTVNGDETLILQLLQNLIGNAIKYHGKEDPIINISAKNEKNRYIFSVEDNGIGIDSEHLNRIFTIFQRLHGMDEYKGTGIGLAISEKIVQQHNGRIWVESKPGKGSTFYFTIPHLQ